MEFEKEELEDLLNRLENLRFTHKNKTEIPANLVPEFFSMMKRFIDERPDFFNIVVSSVKKLLDFGPEYSRNLNKSAKLISNFYILFDNTILKADKSFTNFDRELLGKDLFEVLPNGNQITILGKSCLNAIKDIQVPLHRFLADPNTRTRTVDLIKICNAELKKSNNPEISRDGVLKHLKVLSTKSNGLFEIQLGQKNGKAKYSEASISFNYANAKKIVEDCNGNETAIGQVLWGMALAKIKEPGVFKLPIFVASSLGASLYITKQCSNNINKTIPENVILELAFFIGSKYFHEFFLPGDEKSAIKKIKEGHDYVKNSGLLNYSLGLDIETGIKDILNDFLGEVDDMVETQLNNQDMGRVRV